MTSPPSYPRKVLENHLRILAALQDVLDDDQVDAAVRHRLDLVLGGRSQADAPSLCELK